MTKKIKRNSMVFYRSFYEAIKDLDLIDQAKLYNAIFKYSLDFTKPKLTGINNTIWTLIQPQLDANINKYQNGKKGGRPKAKDNQSKTKTKPKQNQKETKAKPNDNVNVNGNVN